MDNNQKFLDLYRQLESLFRDQGTDYKTVEDGCDDLTQNRMKILRQDRNYLVHQNDPNFIQISNTQLEYLKMIFDETLIEGDTLKDHIKTIQAGCCRDTDTLKTVLKKMSRLKVDRIAVLDGENRFLGFASIHDVIRPYFTKDANEIVLRDGVKKLDKKATCLAPTAQMDVVEALYQGEHVDQILCVDAAGNVLGVYIAE